MINKVFYSLSFLDIQNVAEQELGRKLTPDEIDMVADAVSKRIAWYGIISDVLSVEIKDGGKKSPQKITGI